MTSLDASAGGSNTAGSATISGSQLTVTPVTSFSGTLYVIVTASDATATARRTFAVNVTETPPSIGPIGDSSINAGQSATVNVSASDPDGDNVTIGARVITAAQDAFAVEQQYQVVYTGNWYYNLYGLGEKWLWSYTFGGLAVCVLPDGSVRRYDPAGATGILSDSNLLGRVDPAYYANPLLMTAYYGVSSAPSGYAGSVTVAGSQLTVTPASAFTGPVYVVVSATDGTLTTLRTFTVNVTDNPPVIGTIADQSIATGQSATVAIPASNAGGGPVNWQAQAMTSAQDAYAIVQRLRIIYTGNWYTNLNGLHEKWFWSYTFGGLAVCILPDGSVRRYDPAGAAAILSDKNLLGRVDSSYYANPLALISTPAPTSNAPPATLSVSGSRLTVTPSAGFSGTLYVEIVASDGVLSTRKTFVVAVR